MQNSLLRQAVRELAKALYTQWPGVDTVNFQGAHKKIVNIVSHQEITNEKHHAPTGMEMPLGIPGPC